MIIGSIGHTLAEAERWVPLVDAAGADFIELVSYDESTLVPMIRFAKTVCRKPLLAKLSPNWPDPVASAKAAVAAGYKSGTARKDAHLLTRHRGNLLSGRSKVAQRRYTLDLENISTDRP